MQKTNINSEEFERFVALPQNAERRFELIQGEIVEKMPTLLHGYLIQVITGFLFMFLRQNPIGYAIVEGRYRLPEDGENDLIPDLSFIVKERGPLIRAGAAPFMPDLAVEAQSEGQSDKFMIDKAQIYLQNGTRMVWVIYSTKKLVEVLTPTDRQLLTVEHILDGGEVLPGFKLPVADIFAE